MTEIADRGSPRGVGPIGPRGDGERSRLPQQRPWAQPRMRYKPDRGHVGRRARVDPRRVAARPRGDRDGLPRPGGARASWRRRARRSSRAPQRVRFDRGMVLERIKTAPSQFTLHAPNPAHDLQIGGDWMAFGSVASAPNVVRPGPRPARRQPRRLPELHPAVARCSTSVHFFAGYPVEPIDIHPSVRHLDAIHDLLTLADKAIHATASAASATATRSRWSASRAASTRRRSTASRRSSRSSTRARRSGSTPPMLQGILEMLGPQPGHRA